MKSIIAAVVVLALVVGGLIYADGRWSDEQASPLVKIVTPPVDYMTEDVWTCLQKIGVIDRNNFTSSEPPDHADDTFIWVYKVTNFAREETRAVSIEYGYDGTGSSVVVNCWPPLEWMDWPGVPTVTPYLLPEEVRNGGTPES